MLLRKTSWFWKSGLAAISFVLMLSISGCSDAPPEENTVSETVIDIQAIPEESQENAEEIINICIDLYKKAAEENKIADLETIRSIVNCLGENGYPAVDSRNQINMTEPEKVVKFCEKVDAQEEAEITILEISYLGGFVKYDLHTKDGNVDVVRSYYKYENGNMKREVIGNYQAEYWNYTEEGYLMFSGVWFSEELYVLTLSGAEEHTALRVQPLDETYRDLSRKYLRPISFERNNMFIVDWSENDFGDLNFYDMYDILYPKVNGQYVPYVADDNLSVSAVYQIPKEEFESIIMKYFNIDSETLQSKTVYDSVDSTYEYKPRGFEEVEYPEYPYSEVVGFTENSDGTITLTANVVFPYAGDSKVYAHEVVVRPLEDGGVQYVSNRIIPSEDNYRETWHTPRLTLEEWEGIKSEIQLADSGYGQGQILINPLHLASIYSAFSNDGNIIEPTLLYNPNYNPNIWMPEVIQKESIHTVLETMKKVISEPTATGYGLHREEYTLAGKTGTAEIKLSKEDATGTELGWMAVFTTDPNIENPILLISMVEDVKNIGGSGYVVQKDKRVLDQYLR